MYNVSSMCVTEFAYLKRPLTVDVQLVLSHVTNGILGPSLSHCNLSVISQCKFHNVIFFNAYSCHLKLTPKNGRSAGGVHFLQLYCKKRYGDPHFYFMILIQKVRLPFNEKSY